MDRLQSMHVYVRTVELGSFAAAARELRLSPAMVAKHVEGVEARLGARVLNRTTRRQSLTEVGRLFYERSKALLADFEAAEASALELQAAPRGTLRVTAPVVFGTHAIAPLVADFMQQHPQVQVELALHDRVVDLVDEGFDLAIRSGALPDSGLVGRALAPLTMLLAASPAYLARRGKPRLPADLASHDCLGFEHWVHRDRWRLIDRRDGSEHTVKITSRLRINNGEALRRAALAGAGIVMQSDLLLADDLAAGRLVRVLPRFSPPARQAHVLYLPDRRPSPKLQRFVEFVLQRLAPQAPAALPSTTRAGRA
jgi:DNA-binding transcriptional LysR family regulator